MISRSSMQKRVQFRYLIMPLTLFCSVFILASCMRSPLKVQAEIYPAPIVGKEVTLHIEMFADSQDLPNVTLHVGLPEGIVVIAGETTWQGVLPADNTVTYDLTIKVQEAGEWAIDLYAYSDLGNGNGFGGGRLLYLKSTLTSATVVDMTDNPYPTPPAIQIIDGGSPAPVTATPPR